MLGIIEPLLAALMMVEPTLHFERLFYPGNPHKTKMGIALPLETAQGGPQVVIRPADIGDISLATR